MFFIEIAGVHYYEGDTWTVDPTSTWDEDPTGIWFDECNFRNWLYLTESIDIGLTIYDRSTATFSIWDENATMSFYQGQVVYIRDNTYDLLFGGFIEEVDEERLAGPVAHKVHNITCIDWTLIADKRLVAMAVQNQTLGEIVRTIYETTLRAEGITVGSIQVGDLLDEFRVGYSSVTDTFNALAEYSDFIWFIDEYKRLYFISPSTYTASTALLDSHVLEDSYGHVIGNPDYRNKQFILGGKGTTKLQTESFAGDDNNRSFNVMWPLASVPVIYLDGVLKTVGINQVDTGKDFYWSEDSTTITQDQAGTILSSTNDLEIQYYGKYSIVNAALDATEIAARAAIDGTTGIVETIESGSKLRSQSAARDAAEAKLDKYAVTAKKFVFSTIQSWLACGQMLSISFTAFTFSKSYLVTNIGVSEDQDNENSIPLFKVTCVDGPASTEFSDVFRDINLAAKSGKIQVGDTGDNSELIVYVGFTKTWLAADTPNPYHCGVVGNTEYASDPWIPGFDPDDRWTYVVIYRNGVETFRKEVLAIEFGDTIDYATGYIAPYEAVGDISHIGLWGGNSCSDIAGSGVELEKCAYARNKSELESLQIVFSETRGF